jgi:hypothetical protein
MWEVADSASNMNGMLTLYFLPGYAPELNPDELAPSATATGLACRTTTNGVIAHSTHAARAWTRGEKRRCPAGQGVDAPYNTLRQTGTSANAAPGPCRRGCERVEDSPSLGAVIVAIRRLSSWPSRRIVPSEFPTDDLREMRHTTATFLAVQPHNARVHTTQPLPRTALDAIMQWANRGRNGRYSPKTSGSCKQSPQRIAQGMVLTELAQ